MKKQENDILARFLVLMSNSLWQSIREKKCLYIFVYRKFLHNMLRGVTIQPPQNRERFLAGGGDSPLKPDGRRF